MRLGRSVDVFCVSNSAVNVHDNLPVVEEDGDEQSAQSCYRYCCLRHRGENFKQVFESSDGLRLHVVGPDVNADAIDVVRHQHDIFYADFHDRSMNLKLCPHAPLSGHVLSLRQQVHICRRQSKLLIVQSPIAIEEYGTGCSVI